MGSVRKEKFPKTKQAQWKSPPSVRSRGNWLEIRFQWHIGWWMFHPPPQDPQSDESRHSKDLHHLHKQHWNHSWARYQRRHKHHWWISVLKTANRNTGNGNSRIDDKAKSTQPWPAIMGECTVKLENQTRAIMAAIMFVKGKIDSLPLLGRPSLD